MKSENIAHERNEERVEEGRRLRAASINMGSPKTLEDLVLKKCDFIGLLKSRVGVSRPIVILLPNPVSVA